MKPASERMPVFLLLSRVRVKIYFSVIFIMKDLFFDKNSNKNTKFCLLIFTNLFKSAKMFRIYHFFLYEFNENKINKCIIFMERV